MRLPNGDRAVVEVEKLRDYCLSPHHPRGRHKARLFASALGLRQADAELLRQAILGAARDGEASPGINDEYGQRFVLDFVIRNQGRHATIRSAWIIPAGSELPKLTTCFVL